MQTPVAGTGEDRLARQLGAVHEEQQRDGGGRQPFEEHRAAPFAGEQGGDGNHGEQGQGEVVEEDSELGHEGFLGACGQQGSTLTWAAPSD